MTKDSATKAGPSSSSTHVGKRGAAEIPIYQRILFGLLGIAAGTGGALLILRENSVELGGTALVIVAALFLSLMVIGRLPKMLEVAGVPLEFEQDEMSEFLLTLRAAVDADTLLELENQLKDMSANSKSFKEAQRIADREEEPSAPPSSRTVRVTVRSDKEPTWLTELKTKKSNLTVEKEARILGGVGSGRGQPPRVDYLVRSADQPTLVLEEVPAWNVSTLQVLGRRLNRVMSNHPGLAKLVVIVPDRGLSAAESWREELWGDAQKHKVEILAEGDDTTTAVRNWVNSLPVWQDGPTA